MIVLNRVNSLPNQRIKCLIESLMNNECKENANLFHAIRPSQSFSNHKILMLRLWSFLEFGLKGKGSPIALMAVGEVALKEPICIDNSVTEVGCHSSSSVPFSPSPALKRVRYPFTAG